MVNIGDVGGPGFPPDSSTKPINVGHVGNVGNSSPIPLPDFLKNLSDEIHRFHDRIAAGGKLTDEEKNQLKKDADTLSCYVPDPSLSPTQNAFISHTINAMRGLASHDPAESLATIDMMFGFLDTTIASLNSHPPMSDNEMIVHSWVVQNQYCAEDMKKFPDNPYFQTFLSWNSSEVDLLKRQPGLTEDQKKKCDALSQEYKQLSTAKTPEERAAIMESIQTHTIDLEKTFHQN